MGVQNSKLTRDDVNLFHSKNGRWNGEVRLPPPYSLVSLVGQGSYGAVYKSNDVDKALKVELIKTNSNFDVCREATISKALLPHCNGIMAIECVYTDFIHIQGEDLRRNVYIMPGMDGSIDELYRRSPELQTLCRILEAVRSTLGCMFDNGLPYLDIKKDNVMYSGNKAFIVDYGSMAPGDKNRVIATFPLPYEEPYVDRSRAMKDRWNWTTWLLGVLAFEILFGTPELRPIYAYDVNERHSVEKKQKLKSIIFQKGHVTLEERKTVWMLFRTILEPFEVEDEVSHRHRGDGIIIDIDKDSTITVLYEDANKNDSRGVAYYDVKAQVAFLDDGGNLLPSATSLSSQMNTLMIH